MQEGKLQARVLFKKYKKKDFFLFTKSALISKRLVQMKVWSTWTLIRAFCYHMQKQNFSGGPLLKKLGKCHSLSFIGP